MLCTLYFIETSYMDMSTNSFIVWEYISSCEGISCMRESYTTNIQLSFRSRDSDNGGLLFLVKGDSGAEYIKLQVTSLPI